MLNIVIPMAGLGSRFTSAGYTTPKPLIPLNERPMIAWVVDNIRPFQKHRFIFICQQEHLDAYPEIAKTLRALSPDCEIISINKVTKGAACTVLLAKDLIDNNNPLMIANSDQFINYSIDRYLEMGTLHNQSDGFIMTFEATDPKWSYCRIKKEGTISEVVEKIVVSNCATVGIYNFARGKDFVSAADTMIQQNLRVKNEFYVAPTYNILINQGFQIHPHPIGHEGKQMFGLGTPEDLEGFRKSKCYEERPKSWV